MSQWTLQTLNLLIFFLSYVKSDNKNSLSQVWQKTIIWIWVIVMFVSTSAYFIKRTKERAPSYSRQHSKFNYTFFFPDHGCSWNRTNTTLPFIHSTSTFPLFFPLPSISLWGSEGREQESFIWQMRKLGEF